ncbi:MAG: glycosyltransferase family 39 protein [Hyphomonadaceae bacterium]|nr:glycosyltransferase family 39 protein [Hyphomonadaceae bacterium]
MADHAVASRPSTASPAAVPGLPMWMSLRTFIIFVAGLTLLRVGGLIATPLGLHPDEAQYWAWSRTLDWGYFSKPPLVAWAIAATTALFGNEAWAVRLAAPLAHAGAAAALFALGRRLYGPAAGWWAGVSWLLIPGVWLSSALITTDALLLPLWSAALLAAWRWQETRDLRWALATGALVGLGSLAKYAMLYFPLCLALAALLSAPARRAVLSWQGAAATGVAALVLAPNVYWNATHDFETVAHTAANADWGGDLLNVDQLGAFLGDQVAIAGVMAILLAMAAWRLWRGQSAFDDRARFLLAFVAPPLLVIVGQALISRAHGNWAAAAYPATIVLVAGAFAQGRALMRANVIHAALFAIFLALALAPAAAYRAPLLGRAIENGLKRMNAWPETAALVAARARAAAAEGRPYTAVLVDHRHAYNEFAYHWRDMPDLPPLRMYVLRDAAGNQAEAEAPMTGAVDGRVLVVHMSPRYEPFVAGDFRTFATTERTEVPLGPRKTRALAFSDASGFDPAPRTPEFLARVGE